MIFNIKQDFLFKKTEKSIILELAECRICINDNYYNKNNKDFIININNENNYLIWKKEEEFKKTNKIIGKDLINILKNTPDIFVNKINNNVNISSDFIKIKELNLKPLTFYKEFNGYYIGEFENKQLFQYNIKFISNNQYYIKEYKKFEKSYVIMDFIDCNLHNKDNLYLFNKHINNIY